MFSRMFSALALIGIVSAAVVPDVSTVEKRTGTIVNLRVEGATDTIYEAPIFTYPHNVTTPSGTHPLLTLCPAQARSFSFRGLHLPTPLSTFSLGFSINFGVQVLNLHSLTPSGFVIARNGL